MNLLKDPWIPVRADGGSGTVRLLTYQQLLCEPGNWQVSIPRDDLELACVQLLVCMTQVMFLPEDDKDLRDRISKLLLPKDFVVGVCPCQDWFDLDHPSQPFMQSRGVNGKLTTVQKLLPGLPERTSTAPSAHCFFNEVTEVKQIGGTVAAIALFNLASNSPSFGGGFKGSLRGGAPITTLVCGKDLRDTVWRNVLTRPRLKERQIATLGFPKNQPTWVKPIQVEAAVCWNDIGLLRGLFWQPARIELVKVKQLTSCDVLGGETVSGYSGFRCEKFSFTVEGLWPHPHGTMTMNLKKGTLEHKFASFRATAPAWTLLSEFVVPRGMNDPDAKEGSVPAGPITQASELGEGNLYLMIGGYRANQASVLERRHEMMSLAKGWSDDKQRLSKLVGIGKAAKKTLRDKLYSAVQGDKHKGLKGIGAAIHEPAEKLFYARTEGLIHETFSDELTWKEWSAARSAFANRIVDHCHAIFRELTDPYTRKPELIPIIAWTRRSLNNDLNKLVEEA